MEYFIYQARRKHFPIGEEEVFPKSLVPRHFTVSHASQPADTL